MNGHKKIKFNGIDRLYDNFSWRLTRRAKKVWRSGQVLQGEQMQDLEKKFCKKYKRKYALAVNSATDGLYFAMRACNIGKGSIVTCPVLSFTATSGAIKRTGATVNYADVDRNGNIGDIKLMQKPQAVVYVNLYGNIADYQRIRTYCDENKSWLIEDAAQSQGAEYNGIKSGQLGDISVFSFDPTKNLPCFGSGGMILTDSEYLYQTMLALRRHGLQGRNVEYGYNSLIPEDHCAQLSFLLDKFDALQKKRQKIAQWYYEYLPNGDFIEGNKNTKSSFHKFVIRHYKRDQLKKYLEDAGIETKIHYTYLLDQSNEYPMASNLSKHVLSLPIYPYLEKSEVKYICDIIRKFDGV